MKYNKGTYKVWLVEKGNTFNTFRATIDATEAFLENELKQDMFNEFNVKGDINNFKISIIELGETE